LFLWQSLYHVSNNALNTLLALLSAFFQVFKVIYFCSIGTNKVNLPNNIITVRKLLQITARNNFIEFVVCPKCQSIYKYEDCIYTHRGMQESKTCSYVAFPQHHHRSKRQACGNKLLKKLKTKKDLSLFP